ncbi:asparagine synthase (glutamine-hydrolyzing) [Limnoglobus roseus]|uniref:asparagine synthase (glutamine-hydrolyzing) n=1 Tax=Limnoglobus roseus TaxID=2598579 RepID=A0A5C1A634_9BACT|nr:asparagine synthase (glutamine-hydrolyzing) [Limnoglobus roseus]QEL14669.1 asparagine synthase (glutamine-hydrolyzing) [Limnoglobus roseus]
MCGILAIHNPAGGVTEAELRRGLAVLRHRGPDGTGVWLSPDRTVGIGHTRLGVIDPLGGRQPLVSEDGTVVAAVNGEFYDHDRIRRELESRGHVFRTRSDSEILVHLYEDDSDGVAARLRGEFAFVLWDTRRRRLLAARDPFGVKPLVFHADSRRTVFASEAKALFALGVPAAWDAAALWQVCGMQYPLPGQTLFRGVRELLPGGAATLSPTGPPTIWEYDPIEANVAGTTDGDSGHLAALLRAKLDEAVRLRLRADVPVCFHLSGGLDSTSIVALAKRHLGRPPVCFTVGFDAPAYDELDEARESAAFLGAELHEVRVSQRDQFDHLEDAVYYSEGLAINGHLPAKYLLARAVRRAGFKVVLSGEGADEILGGYAHFRQDLLGDDPAALAALKAANADMAGIQLPEGDGLPLAAVQERFGFVPAFLQAKATLGLRLRGLLRPEFVAEFAAVDPYREFVARFPRLTGRDRVDVSSHLWTRSALAKYILRTLGDGTEMAHGVEGRVPFLDPVLARFASGLPTSVKIRDGVEKWLLREALKDVLPPAVYARRKHPFTAPPPARFAREFFRDRLSPTALAGSPCFDPAAVGRFLDQLDTAGDAARTAADPALMIVLTSVLLQERLGLSA